MNSEILTPAPTRVSQYGVDPKFITKRASELEGITGVGLSQLIGDLPETIYPSEKGISAVREYTTKALEKVDFSKITKDSTVNILASHHGFTFMGGQPYSEMLRTIKDIVESKTSAREVRLRAGLGMRFRETEEYIKAFGLDEYFNGKAVGMAPIDAGIEIDTKLGTLFGLKRAYDADFIIHAHNSDVREIHFHRQVDRAVKPFGMSYARCETRSTYHMNLGPRAANFVARAIFESDFVQKKFAFACFLVMSPAGAIDVDADNDLFSLNNRLTASGMKHYGKIVELMGAIKECIVVLDFPCPVPYVFASGVIYANLVSANIDVFDLDKPLPPYTWYTETYYDDTGKPLLTDIPEVNPAIKAVVHNYAWIGYPSVFFAEHTPTIMVGEEQAKLFDRDPMNQNYMKHALRADNLDTAIAFAKKTTGTDKIIVFDGASGGLNVSKSLAEELKNISAGVCARVDNELLPKWLAQRNVDPNILENIA